MYALKKGFTVDWRSNIVIEGFDPDSMNPDPAFKLNTDPDPKKFCKWKKF